MKLSVNTDSFTLSQKKMKTIQKRGENMGGIVKLWAIPPSDCTIEAMNMTILSGTNMVEIYIQEDSGCFIEEDITGPAFKTEIVGQVPCDHPHSLAIITLMERTLKYNVIFQDGNGNYKLAGTKSVPLRFSAKLVTGATSSSLDHYAISFLAKVITSRAVFIEDPFR